MLFTQATANEGVCPRPDAQSHEEQHGHNEFGHGPEFIEAENMLIEDMQQGRMVA